MDLRENVDEVYSAADFITVHMPMTDETKGMVNAAAFAKMKKGVRVLNCARGGIIKEADLSPPCKAARWAEPDWMFMRPNRPRPIFHCASLPQVVMTPHLGASTEEAQENVGIEVAEAITDYLLSGGVRNAVNLPNLDAQTYPGGQTVFEPGRKTRPACWPSLHPNATTGSSSLTAAARRNCRPTR